MLFALATPLVLTQGLASDDYKGRLQCPIQASLCSQLTQVAVPNLSVATPLLSERGYELIMPATRQQMISRYPRVPSSLQISKTACQPASWWVF